MQLNALTSLRFIAALFVFFSHSFWLDDSKSNFISSAYKGIFSEGYIGVTFFFILSGFILTYAYEGRFASSSVSKYEFYIARIAKIYPLHFFGVILSLPFLYFTIKNGGGWETYLPNFLLIQSFFDHSNVYFSVNMPSWSLSNELFFYFLFPFLVLSSKKIVMIVLFFCVSIQLLIPQYTTNIHYWIYIFPVSRLADFCMGIIVYHFFKKYNLTSYVSISILQFISVICLVALFGMKEMIPQFLRYDIYYIIPMAFIIYSFSHDDGFLSSMLNCRFFILLGESSFAFYVIHQLVIRYATIITEHLFTIYSPLVDVLLLVVTLFFSIVFSIIINRFFEAPSKNFVLECLKLKRAC